MVTWSPEKVALPSTSFWFILAEVLARQKDSAGRWPTGPAQSFGIWGTKDTSNPKGDHALSKGPAPTRAVPGFLCHNLFGHRHLSGSQMASMVQWEPDN